MLVHGTQILVDSELYQLYVRLCPEPLQETLRLLCEERLSVREVLGRVECSPVEVEDLVRDLVCRGVVTLSMKSGQ